MHPCKLKKIWHSHAPNVKLETLWLKSHMQKPWLISWTKFVSIAQECANLTVSCTLHNNVNFKASVEVHNTVYSKTSKQEAFSFRMEIFYTQEIFHSSMLVDSHCQWTRSQFIWKSSQNFWKLWKFFHLNVLP